MTETIISGSFQGEWNGREKVPHCFFQVADQVYHDDPSWIPETRQNISAQFYNHNPYFNKKNRVWLAVECGKTRLAGFFNPDDSARIDDQVVAYFGYWESINDLVTCKRLFSAFEQWAKSHGVQKIYGPINFTTFGPYRVRMNQFEHGYFPGEPYNPEYYPDLMHDLGYNVEKRFYSWFGKVKDRHVLLSKNLEPQLRKAEEAGLKFEKLTPEYWLNNLETIYENVDDIFRDNFAYTGIDYSRFAVDYGKPFANKFCPETSVLVLDTNDNMVGFFATFPDYSPLLQSANKNRLEMSEITYEKHFPLLEKPLILGKSLGISKKYRSLGLFPLMSYFTLKNAQGLYEHVSAATIREDNITAKVASVVFSQPGDWSHEYALFGKSI